MESELKIYLRNIIPLYIYHMRLAQEEKNERMMNYYVGKIAAYWDCLLVISPKEYEELHKEIYGNDD